MLELKAPYKLPRLCNECDESQCELKPVMQFQTLCFICVKGEYFGEE